MSTTRKLLLVFLATIFAAAPSFPQDYGKGEETRFVVAFGPQIGFHKTKDADDGKMMLGAAVRLKPLPALGVEGSVGYRSEDFADDALKVRSWPILVTGLFYPLPIVYGAVGAGWYNTTFEFEGPGSVSIEETNQEFGWHLGAGVEVPLGDITTLTGDIRYAFLNYDFEDVPFEEVDSNFYMITAGLLVWF